LCKKQNAQEDAEVAAVLYSASDEPSHKRVTATQAIAFHQDLA